MTKTAMWTDCFGRALRVAALVLVCGVAAPPIGPAAGATPCRPAEAPEAAAEVDCVPAVPAAQFLDSLGVNTHVDQGYDAASYIAPLRYMGIRQVRDGARHVPELLTIHQQTGVRFVLTGAGDVASLMDAARTLAQADALLALEGANEPNNFPLSYQGAKGGGRGNTWMPVAEFQRALYAAVQDDPLLRRYKVFGPSEVGAETDNVGLQFLTIPAGAGAMLPDGTRYADYLNVHNYVSGNGNHYGDNQAWNAADPTLRARWDGLAGNHGVTWSKHYQGYSDAALATVSRVTTETGWDSISDAGGEHTQGTVLTNTYLAQFRRGWRYTFIYELRDGEGGEGHQGLYSGATPKPAATYIHNLTSILADDASTGAPSAVAYRVTCDCATVHDLLLQTAERRFALVVWDERTSGTDDVVVRFGDAPGAVRIFDVTAGTSPVAQMASARSVPLSLSDHAMILQFGD